MKEQDVAFFKVGLLILICAVTGTPFWYLAVAMGGLWLLGQLLLWGLNWNAPERVTARRVAREERHRAAKEEAEKPMPWKFLVVITTVTTVVATLGAKDQAHAILSAILVPAFFGGIALLGLGMRYGIRRGWRGFY
jgi:hypothetical protein